MNRTIWDQYRSKLRAADEAVKIVKSGDNVYYSHFAMFPRVLDGALAKRTGEMTDVDVITVSGMVPAQIATNDPEHRTFTYSSSFFSNAERQLSKKGMCVFRPSNYSEAPRKVLTGELPKPNVAMIKTTPMDEHGFFNLGTSVSYIRACLDMADKIIVEVNEGVPTCLGGFGESIHISEVEYIVETEKAPMLTIPRIQASEEDKKIAAYIIDSIHDGSCVQLGIGGIPNTVGGLIAESDLKDLGMHSEMMVDAYMDLYLKGKISGKYKYTDKRKMVYTFCMGSQELYDFIHKNPACATYPVDYTNTPENIARNDNMISINNTLQVDIWGQICSEAQGRKHISGSGGQADFVSGATKSKGGKSFLCMRSTRMMGDQMVSRIVPEVTGIVSVTRAQANYIVTEYGMVDLKGKSTWQVAEAIISLAHPQFRDGLIKAAEERDIWKRSNKII
ncbi:MAG: acetyl-CoA hydrolase/transferase C-terminal domain-containing protein [Syntrophales bacterium]|nr:acetyl-CoA hydrolase/transferase C-terminal domain-containing protein [Syntrophales bacterium]